MSEDKYHRKPIRLSAGIHPGIKISMVGRPDRGRAYIRFEGPNGEYLGSIAEDDNGFRRLKRWVQRVSEGVK